MQEGKMKIFFEINFENNPQYAKHAIFATEWVATKSPVQAAKTLKDKRLKIFLSVFRDWKVYPRESRELSLANKSPNMTREGATESRDLTYPRLSRQNRAKLGFLKNFRFLTKYFPKTPKTLKNLFVLELTKI